MYVQKAWNEMMTVQALALPTIMIFICLLYNYSIWRWKLRKYSNLIVLNLVFETNL